MATSLEWKVRNIECKACCFVSRCGNTRSRDHLSLLRIRSIGYRQVLGVGRKMQVSLIKPFRNSEIAIAFPTRAAHGDRHATEVNVSGTRNLELVNSFQCIATHLQPSSSLCDSWTFQDISVLSLRSNHPTRVAWQSLLGTDVEGTLVLQHEMSIWHLLGQCSGFLAIHIQTQKWPGTTPSS